MTVYLDEESRKFEEAAAQVRKLATSYKEIRWVAARLAVEVCDIQRGGHGHNKEIFSLKMFAERAGLNWKTLLVWTNDYKKVVLKLPEEMRETADHQALRRVARRVNLSTDEEKVLALYNRELRQNTLTLKLMETLKRVKTASLFICNDAPLGTMDKKMLFELYEVVLDMEVSLASVLTTDRKKKKRTVTDTEKNAIKRLGRIE